jgi:hypothetical protein
LDGGVPWPVRHTEGKGVYSHTPEWEYFDLHKNAPYTGWDSSSHLVEMQAEPIED